MNTASENKIAIVGMGIESSIGKNVTEFKHALKAGISGVSHLKQKNQIEAPIYYGAEIDNISFSQRLSEFSGLSNQFIETAMKLGSRSPTSIQASILSAIESWKDSNMFERDMDPTRIGIVIGGENTTSNYQYELHEQYQKNPEYLSPRYALQFFDSHQIGILSELFQIKGESFVAGGASASGNIAIIKAMQMIHLGIIDVCLVVGTLADLSPMDLQGFINIGAMVNENKFSSPQEASRPFDIDHCGFVYGQAAACVVIESYNSAINSETNIRSKLLSGSMNLDSTSYSAPSVEGQVNVMRLAIYNSGISVEEVDYINSHGSSSPLGDRTECTSIKNVFNGRNQKLRINSTKGLTGHCLYSAGVVELIACVVQIEGEFIHPCINLTNPIDSELSFVKNNFEQVKINYAMSNSFAFNGINTSLVIER